MLGAGQQDFLSFQEPRVSSRRTFQGQALISSQKPVIVEQAVQVRKRMTGTKSCVLHFGLKKTYTATRLREEAARWKCRQIIVLRSNLPDQIIASSGAYA